VQKQSIFNSDCVLNPVFVVFVLLLFTVLVFFFAGDLHAYSDIRTP